MRKDPVLLRCLDVPIEGLAPSLSGLRIAHVSDFHFRRWTPVYDRAQKLLLSAEYDFLVATGDLGTHPGNWERARGLIRRFFDPLAARTPCYAVLGNHDHPAMADNGVTPLRFLRNESLSIDHRGESIAIAGVDQSLSGCEDLGTALATATEGRLQILLAHYPSTVFRLSSSSVNLQLSGHTHGGQIRFPWLGCIWPNDRISRHMARGLHEVSGVTLHTSPGIGVSMILPMRVNCPAEVTILALKPSAQLGTNDMTGIPVEAFAP